MSLFTNRTINLLNIQNAIERLAESSFVVFGPIFLLQQWLGIPVICLFFGLALFLRIPFRIMWIPFIKKIWVKPAIIIGALGIWASYLFLPFVHGVDIYLRLYTVIGCAFSALYRQLYHYLFTHYGNNDNRGDDVSSHIILLQWLQMASPLLSALVIHYQSFTVYTILVSLLFIITSIVLLLIKKVPSIGQIPSLDISFKKNDMYGLRISIYASAIENSYKFLRIIIIFLTLGEVVSFGGVLTLWITIGLVLQIFIGKYIDRGKGILVNLVGSLSNAVILLLRTFVWYSFLPIALLEWTEKLSANVNNSAYSVGYYNKGKQSHDQFWYILRSETWRDIGGMLWLFSVAWLIVIGTTPRLSMLVWIIPIILLWYVIDRYYKKDHLLPKNSKF